MYARRSFIQPRCLAERWPFRIRSPDARAERDQQDTRARRAGTGQSLEWVRVGFKKAVAPTQVTVFETFNPGSVVCIRGAERPVGPQAVRTASASMGRGASSIKETIGMEKQDQSWPGPVTGSGIRRANT